MYDLLIVGQGLAGTLLAHFALKRNLSIKIIDNFNSNSASNVAAGVVNPITGRKMLKTWMADTVLPYSKNTYREIENKLEVNFFEEVPILKLFSSEIDIEIWNKHCTNEEYKRYLSTATHFDNPAINATFGVGKINQTFWLDTKILIQSYRKFFIEQNILEDEIFNFEQLIINNNYINYKNINSKYIIFCEGYNVIHNPYFNFIPLRTAKGEILKIKSESLKLKYIINKNIFIIPTKNNEYYVGSNYLWNDLSEHVTEDGKNEILLKLEKTINCPYHIIEEKAGIRPTIKDRRPAIGKHPNHNNLYVLNGLGTKGISLSPYFSNHLLSHIFDNQELIKDVDVSRFY